ncbi:MAG TPA: TonB-dependent receptor [Longimicrobiales bacterium]
MNNRIAFLLIVACAQNAFAQETQDTFRLEQVVVSATRLPHPITSVPAAVSVVTSDEFTRLGLRNVADVLRTVSGAALVQGGSYGALSSLFLRGGESDYVQVLLDGVQINSPGELFDYSALSLDNIERIEVVKGPVSVLYGSDAVAGVVQLFSKQGSGRTRAQVTVLGGAGGKVGAGAQGNFKSIDLRADINGGSTALHYSAGLTHFGTEGALAYNNEHQLTSGTARVAGRLGNAFHAAVSARATRNLFHYPTDGAGNLVDGNQFHEANAFAAGLDAGYRLQPNSELRAQLSWSRNQDHIDDAPDSPADTLGFFSFLSDEDFSRGSLDVRWNRNLSPNTVLTAGGELERQRRTGSSISESDFGDFESSGDNERNNRAAYAQLVTTGRIGVQTGLRVDHSDAFGDFFTYRAGASLKLSRQLRARASIGTAFKEPRFFEQFSEGFGTTGNPALEPERSRAFELGADYNTQHWFFGATGFAQTFEDLIQYSFAPPPAVNYFNVGEVRANGLELESAFSRGALALRGNWTLFHTRVEDAGDGSDPLYQEGERLVRRPRHTATLTANYGTDYNVGVVVSYVGERDDIFYDDTFTARRVELPGYTKVDLNLRTPAFGGLQGIVKFENLLAEDYEEIRGFPARGRVVFLGATLER